jgi:hypothetical protein
MLAFTKYAEKTKKKLGITYPDAHKLRHIKPNPEWVHLTLFCPVISIVNANNKCVTGT